AGEGDQPPEVPRGGPDPQRLRADRRHARAVRRVHARGPQVRRHPGEELGDQARLKRGGYKHDVKIVEGVVEALRAAEITFATYLPDTLHYPIAQRLEEDSHFTCLACS